MSKITHIGRNFFTMNLGSKKVLELFPGLKIRSLTLIFLLFSLSLFVFETLCLGHKFLSLNKLIYKNFTNQSKLNQHIHLITNLFCFPKTSTSKSFNITTLINVTKLYLIVFVTVIFSSFLNDIVHW